MRGIQVDGARFRQIRRARGLTQQELAKIAGVGERTVRNAESGRRVRLDFLRYLAIALAVDLDYLVLEPDELQAAFDEAARADRLSLALLALAQERDMSEYESLMDKSRFRMTYPAPCPFAGIHRGLAGARRVMELAAEILVYEKPTVVAEIRASGNFVILSGTDYLTNRATGATCESWWQHICEFENDRLVRIDCLVDTHALRQAFGP